MVQKYKKEEAIKLRFQGKSYGEILKILDLPSKGTLSAWFKELKLSPEAKKILRGKMFIARKRNLLRFNEERTKKIINENKSIFSNAGKEIKKLSDYELKLVGAMLYWGEGTIHHGRYRYPRLSFSNSNPEMVKIYLSFLRKILKVENDKILVGIHIHPNISENRARKFWQEITGLSGSKFYIFRQISRSSGLKRDKKFLPCGTIQITVTRRQLFYQVQGYINGIVKQLVKIKRL